MANILIAWELGANFGHLTRELPIAQRLRAAGHRVLFAVRETASAHTLLTPQGFRFVAAPTYTEHHKVAPMANFSEMLLALGYADAASLEGRVMAWRSLFELTRADLVVVDHSPSALLAARTARLRAIPIGGGFEIPPRLSPLPSIRPWTQIAPERLARSDERLLRCINGCLRRFKGTEPIGHVADLFDDPDRIFATFAELDPYGMREGTTYWGPLFSSMSTTRVEWQAKDVPRIIAYLRNGTSGLSNLLKSMKTSGAEVICVVPGVREQQCQALSSGAFRLLSKPVDLDPLLSGADLVIHSGAGTAAQALLAGVPVMSLPATVEQYLQGKRVESFGAGLAIGPERTLESLSSSLSRMLSEKAYKTHAARFAERYAGFNPEQVADHAARVVDRATTESGLSVH